MAQQKKKKLTKKEESLLRRDEDLRLKEEELERREKKRSSSGGGVLAPTLIAGGTGSIMYGVKKISKAENQKRALPGLIDKARQVNHEGIQKVDNLRNSWGGLGKYLRKEKINRTREAAEKNTENALRQVRKMDRASKFNRLKGKALIGAGTVAGLYGLHKLTKRSDE